MTWLAQAIAEENALNIRLRLLELIIGKAPGELDTLADKATLPPPVPAVIDEWAARAEANNLNVAIQRSNKAIADEEIERARAGHYPTVDAIAGYRYNENQSLGVTLVDVQTALVGVEFNLPIYEGGRVNSQVRQAVANLPPLQREVFIIFEYHEMSLVEIALVAETRRPWRSGPGPAIRGRATPHPTSPLGAPERPPLQDLHPPRRHRTRTIGQGRASL